MRIDDPKLHNDFLKVPKWYRSEKPTLHYTTRVPIFISLHLHKEKMEI